MDQFNASDKFSDMDDGPISLDHLQRMWDELNVLARNVRREANQWGHSYRTSDILLSAMRRLAADASKWSQNGEELTWDNRVAFFAAAATAMHRAVIDHIRQRTAEKRPTGNSRRRVPLEDGMWLARTAPDTLLDLETCLDRLRETHPELAELFVKKLYLPFSSLEELSSIVDIPSSTLSDKLIKARAHLAFCLGFNDV